MKTLILYFSGTGNTAYVARYLAVRLSAENQDVALFSIETFPKETLANYDLLVFGFPVYACDMPPYVQDYLAKIPLPTSQSVLIFCTKAMTSGPGLLHAQTVFALNGYRILGLADFTLPGSDALAFTRKDSRTVQKIKQRDFSVLPEVDVLIERFLQIQQVFDTDEPLDRFQVIAKIGPGKRLAGCLMMKSYPFFENLIKDKYWADERCILCHKCEKICPTHNIKVTNRVEFDHRCMLCMRCIHQCPVEAIQIGKKTVNKFRWKGPDGSFDPAK